MNFIASKKALYSKGSNIGFGKCWLFVMITCLLSLFSYHIHAIDVVKFEKEFGGKGSGAGAFGKNVNIAFDKQNNIYISDKDNKMLQKLDPDGNFIMQIPRSQDRSQLFNAPGDISVDAKGNIYVADWSAKYIEGTENPRLYFYGPCVHKFDPDGKLVRTYFIDDFAPKPKTVMPGTFVVDETGNYGWALQPKDYNREVLVGVDDYENVYVLDVKNNVLHKLDPSGQKVASFCSYGSGRGEIDNASDMLVEGNDIYIADKGNNRIVKLTTNGAHQLSFGSKGHENGQFIEPIFIMLTHNNEILVKDSSKFERIGLKYPFGRDEETLPGEEYLIQPYKDVDMSILEYRVKRLEEAIRNSESKEEAKEKLLAKHSRYYTVIERIQSFDKDGRYKDRIIYKIDKTSSELHDLEFLAIDRLGRLYLRDQDRLVIRRYIIQRFVPKLSEVEATYTARAENRDENFIEDYSDLDKKTDLEDVRAQLGLRQILMFNYDLTERWNLSLYNTHLLDRRDSTYETPPKPEDNYDYSDRGWDNDAGLNLKFIADPDPYRYRELNFYSKFITGQSEYRTSAIFENVNKQRSLREGNSLGVILGTDIDIHHNVNVSLEYHRLRPDLSSRNIDTWLYDVSGDLYQTSKSFNRANVIVGEINIKF